VIFSIPESVASALKLADESEAPVDEGMLAGELRKAAGDPSALTAEEKRGVWVEFAPFEFMTSTEGRAGPWDSYFVPGATFERNDGTQAYIPDAADMDADAVAHWVARAEAAKHPALRARYADLVWELASRVTGAKPDIRFARMAVDAYLETVVRELTDSEHQTWRFAVRALELSISISDEARLQAAKTTLFAIHRPPRPDGKRGMWWLLDEALADNKGARLTREERAEIIDGVEAVLRSASNIEEASSFDPFATQDAADRLARHYARLKRPDDVVRVVRTAGDAFEKVAEQAEPLLATTWLQDVYRRYRQAGLNADAARVEAAIRARAQAVRDSAKRIEIPLHIKPEEVQKWLQAITDGDSAAVLRRLGGHFLLRADDVEAQTKKAMEIAPITAILPIDIGGGDGFSVARIGSVEDDLDGRTIHQGATALGFQGGWLASAIDRTRERLGLLPEHVLAFLASSPMLAETDAALLKEGIEAYFAGDQVKAIHLLVPQLENILRAFLRALGAPTMRSDPNVGGFQAIGMGEILSSPAFKERFDKNVRFHFRALYADRRGINLRNNLAHGLIAHEQLTRPLSDWVIHSLLLIPLLAPSKTAVAASAAGE
jgi:hypothetical protein